MSATIFSPVPRGSGLTGFLARLPWAGRELLDGYFGPDRAEELLASEHEGITSVECADGRRLYAAAPGNERLLPGVARREMVRRTMARIFGPGIFANAVSPFCNADLCFMPGDRESPVRVWGDTGRLPPESLMMFRTLPERGAWTDVIVTAGGEERAGSLRAQIFPADVRVIRTEAAAMLSPSAFALTGEKGTGAPFRDSLPRFSTDQIPSFNDTGRRKLNGQEIRSRRIAAFSLRLTARDLDLLSFIACSPFLSEKTLALLFGGSSCDAGDYAGCEAEYREIQRALADIRRLAGMGLLERKGGGWVPTWQGLDLLAAYHGSAPILLAKYCPWPLVPFGKADFDENRELMDPDHPFFDSHCRYGARPPDRQQRLCRQIGSALILGARSLKADKGQRIWIKDMRTLPSELSIPMSFRGKRVFRSLRPDGSFDLFYGRGGKRAKLKVLFRIVRKTETGKALTEMMERCRRFMPAAREFYADCSGIRLMFFMDDEWESTEAAEEKTLLLLGEMRRSGIPGYVAKISDALSAVPCFPPKHGEAEREASGGLDLSARIWRSPDLEDPCGKTRFPGTL